MKRPRGPLGRGEGRWLSFRRKGGYHWCWWGPKVGVVMWRGCFSHGGDAQPCPCVLGRRKVKMPDVVALANAQVGRALEESVVLADLPVLSSFLLEQNWQEAIPKGERALMVFFKATGACNAILKVEHPPLKLSVVASSFDEVLAGLEASLRLEHPPFLPDDRPLGVSKKKAK